jgi:hypothetical protein
MEVLQITDRKYSGTHELDVLRKRVLILPELSNQNKKVKNEAYFEN